MLASLSEPLAGFFSWLTRSSVQTGVLICLILAVQVVLRSRLAPRWRYALWLLVIVRLALPWAPESPVSVFNLYRLAEANAPHQATPVEPHGVAGPVLYIESALPRDDQPVEVSAAGAAGGETAAVGKPSQIDIRHWLIPLVWLIGALVVMACAVVESISLASGIRRRRLVTDQKTLDLLEDCKAELGVHSYLAVVETPRVKSPALFGFLRPCLLLPPGAIESLGRERMRHVFLHELTHLKRHDIAANWVMTLLQALHWFNPLVWYGFYRMRADRELARDAAVLARFRPEELPQYGMTIVHLLETFSQRRRVPCLAGVLEDKNLIRRRIEMIASFKQSPSRWSVLAIALTVVLGTLTLTNAQQPATTSGLNAKVAPIEIDKAKERPPKEAKESRDSDVDTLHALAAKLGIDKANMDDAIRLLSKRGCDAKTLVAKLGINKANLVLPSNLDDNTLVAKLGIDKATLDDVKRLLNRQTVVTLWSAPAQYQDVRGKDMSGLVLSTAPELPATLRFNQKTIWPAALPAGVDPEKLLSAAMNPGLGIRKLHEEGLTGKGVNVAIIDQPLYQDHPEFAGKIAAYHDVGCKSESSMHGPAVTSLLVGSKCGTAPDARVYYVAAPSWTADTAFQAKALDWIVEQNAKLPPEGKIRVVSVSAAPSGPGSPFTKNAEMWDAAWGRAEKAGILVLDCTRHRGFIGSCYYDASDPENVSKCKAGYPGVTGMPGTGGRLLAPSSPRTTAEEYVKGECAYQYCGRGGLSWSIPYCAGVLALGWQSRPDLDATQMRELLFKSAHKTADGSLIINPPEFLRMVKAAR
jgi:beta-lactamase regulating signal transducer with metallopeptidase domain